MDKINIFSISNNEFKDDKSKPKQLVVIACSTGGPEALQHIIPRLPENLNAPVLVVQHMLKGMTEPLANRLDSLSQMKVKEASEHDVLHNGVVYVAKSGFHLTVDWNNSNATVFFDDSPAVNGIKPYADKLFDSLAACKYKEIICVVLTGMGQDGTAGIQRLRRTHKLYVIGQSEQSSTVYGMPKAVYQNGLTDIVCDLDEIADYIIRKVGEC